jgi:hypothetical protein
MLAVDLRSFTRPDFRGWPGLPGLRRVLEAGRKLDQRIPATGRWTELDLGSIAA